MHRQRDDLKALATHLTDLRSALGSMPADGEERRLGAAVLAEALDGIERFIVGATARLERSTAQADALRASRTRYRDLVDHLPVAIYVNRGDRIVLANAACAALFGAESPALLLGRSPFDFYDPADHALVRDRIRELRAHRVGLPSAPHRVVRLDGQRLEVEVAASSFDDGGRRATHVVLRDVTEQRASERRVRSLNAMLDGVRRVNRLITRERSPGELLRKSLEVLVEARGLAAATVVLREPIGLRVGAAAGALERTQRFASLVAREPTPPCVSRALAGETAVLSARSSACADCAGVAGEDHTVICTPLSVEGRAFGILHAVLPSGATGDGEEVGLLSELASDMAFALRSIELERGAWESEERFRNGFESAAAGRSISSPDGRIFRVNRALAGMLGLRPEAMIGRAVEEFIHPDDQEWSRESGLRLLRGEGSSFHSEMRFLHADGSAIWADLNTSLYRDSAGNPVHFFADAQDITSRKRAEAESERRGARLQALAEVARVLASARDTAEVAAVVPRAARALLEADGANLLIRDGERCREAAEAEMGPLWKGARTPECGSACRWALRQGVPLAIEDVFTDPRVPTEEYRSTFVQSLAATPVGRGEPRGAIGVYWATRHAPTPIELELLQALADSTSIALENIAAWERLRGSEERYRSLIESLDDLVYAVDVEGRLTYVSGAVSRYGFAPGEVIGRRFRDFAHPDDREALASAFGERLAADVGPYEFRVIDAAGKVRVVRSSGRRIFEGGRFTGLAGVLIDLTVQRSTEEQLRLAQKMEAVGRLAGGVAHDFNNLLTVINSYARLAARGLASDDPRRTDLDEIRQAGDRASALTRQLLAFSRRQVLRPDVLDVNQLVAGTERMLRRLIGEDMELRFAPGANLGAIRADPGQVEQVVMNLAINARDAMPGGGRLLIETADVELDREFVARHPGSRQGPFVRIRVSDTGCGMDAATLERLFEPFFTTKAPGKGTGLGLATVYGIVKQSGGSIWVSSEPGQGAVFDVYFPRVLETVSPRSSPPTEAATAGRGGTLLFVEDDEAIRALARQVLGDEGYDVLLAANAGEALHLAERHRGRIELVLTDVVMPGMSGMDLAARLSPLLRDTPILFMSGYGHDAIGQHGVLEPGTLFLPKPFTPESLVARVREILSAVR